MRRTDYGLISTRANPPHTLRAVAGHHPTREPAEHEIHLPGPSLSPPLLGLGVTLLAFGVLFGPILIVVGIVIFLVGLLTWLIDDARAFSRANDEGHH